MAGHHAHKSSRSQQLALLATGLCTASALVAAFLGPLVELELPWRGAVHCPGVPKQDIATLEQADDRPSCRLLVSHLLSPLHLIAPHLIALADPQQVVSGWAQ
eukprot:CAMPEP_0174700246 /NCGR_PEP_ID=MMETSP1094-20130205/5257_1 /TAXON_ID=156173 /ORGANISM="Chrysochromulina brevifilum, Strain UTEX LB 985" /LENGTH=102 /DNA_ID=CAMNT_0015897691 /DNA_START=232 /DNA_END=540 /DNA_ORIENTATION=+